ILKNLLSNAFKFTSAGGVLMSIRPALIERGEPMVSFVVQDSGIGIAPDKQKLIFEAFQQADGTISRRYGGTGLGLTISLEIARLLGGSIEVVSAPGERSTFTLTLPATRSGAEMAMLEERQGEDERFEGAVRMLRDGASFAGATILLVDDDARNIFALRSVL